MNSAVVISSIVALFLSLPAQSQHAGTEDRSGWLIPQEKVFDGGPPKDGIPALQSPRYVHARDLSWLRDDDLVVGMLGGEEPQAYPHAILNWHEIINEELNGERVSLTYCPLTGSGIAWEGTAGSRPTTFGVSGLLYSSNLLAYDRVTESYWSQMRLECVGGQMKGEKVNTIPAVETTWRQWKKWFPESKVVSNTTGFRRDYTRYPYGAYRESDYLLFEVERTDSHLPPKERVLGVIVGDSVRVYRFGTFSGPVRVIQDQVNGIDLVVVGSQEANYLAAFVNEKQLTFGNPEGHGPAVLTDEDGTARDIFGRGISGPGKGTRLQAARSFIAYWFAWAAFYPETDIYGE